MCSFLPTLAINMWGYYEGGSKSFRPDQLFKVTNKTTLLFFNIVSLYFNTYWHWYINLIIDGAIYPSQHFPFGAAFVCQAGNFWTYPRSYPILMKIPEHIAIQFWWQYFSTYLPNSDDRTWLHNYPILMKILKYIATQFWREYLNTWLLNSDGSTWIFRYQILMKITEYIAIQFWWKCLNM